MKQNACIASFHCLYPVNNICFQKVSVPRPKSQIVIVGFITGPSLPFSTMSSIKRIPIEVAEIQYLASAPMTSPVSVKGLIYLIKNADYSFLGEPSSMFRKHGGDATTKQSLQASPIAGPSSSSCYDFKRFRQSSTVVGLKVRGQMSPEECKS